VNFVDQDVAAAAGVDRGLRWTRIAGNHDAPVGRVEPIPVTLHGMLGHERRHRDVLVFVYDALSDLVRIHFVAVRKRSLIAFRVGARLDVRPVRFEQMHGHLFQALWPVDLERDSTAQRPGTEDQVRVPDRVI
jgi:hypothetical protein